MKVLVTPETHNKAAAQVPDRRAAWAAWMRENGIPSKKIIRAVYDTDAWTLTVERLASWQGGTHDGCSFCGYRNATGEWVMDGASPAAVEGPETYCYYTDPADWMLACGEVLP